MNQDEIKNMIIKYRKNLLKKEYLIDIFTVVVHEDIKSVTVTYPGKIVSDNDSLFYLDEENKPIFIKKKDNKPIANITDIITINKGDIENLFVDTIKTTYGRYLVNYCLLVIPFIKRYTNLTDKVKKLVSFKNEPWPSGKIRNAIPMLALTDELDHIEVNNFIEAYSYIATFPTLATPGNTSASSGGFERVTKRKKELLEQYKTELANNDELVMAKIEAELVSIFQEEVKNDPAFRLLGADTKKFIKTANKRMLCSIGMLEDFSEKGKFTFIANSLDEGIDIKDIPALNNDVRYGVYQRGTETAKGGEIVNFLVRVFLDARIAEDDCKSLSGIEVTINEKNKQEYIGRYMIKGNTYTSLDESDLDKLVGQTITIRSPKYCKTNPGYCYVCMGDIFKKLNTKSLTLLATEPGSVFMYTAMKAMHGVVRSVIDVSKLNRFCL